MSSKRRPWTDAPGFFRCQHKITLSDKTTAQCGRWQNLEYRGTPLHGYCTQHAKMRIREANALARLRG